MHKPKLKNKFLRNAFLGAVFFAALFILRPPAAFAQMWICTENFSCKSLGQQCPPMADSASGYGPTQTDASYNLYTNEAIDCSGLLTCHGGKSCSTFVTPPPAPPPPPPISVSLSPSAATVLTNQTQQFTANVSGTFWIWPDTVNLDITAGPTTAQFSTNSPTVTWSVNNVPGGNATLGTVSPTGLYTLPGIGSPIYNSSTKIYVIETSPLNPTLVSWAIVNETASGGCSTGWCSTPTVVDFTLDPVSPVDNTLTVTGDIYGAVDRWKSPDDCLNSKGFPIPTNEATAYQVVNPGTYNIDGGAGGSFTFVMTTAGTDKGCAAGGGTPYVYSFSFTDSTNISSLAPGLHLFNVCVNGGATCNSLPFLVKRSFFPAVSWTVNGIANGNSTFGIVDPSGLYTAPASVPSPATFPLTATSQADPTKTASSNVTVNAAAVPPSIVTQPANQTVIVGSTATFTVVAAGTAPLSYQWRKNGVNIAGATAASYTTPATVLADNGSLFSVVVTGAALPVATSNNATLTVNQPTFTIGPPSTSTTVGSTAQFTGFYDPDGAGPQPTVVVTASAVWSSLNAAVATPTATPGQFTGVAAGSATINATYLGIPANATLNVSAPIDFSLTTAPASQNGAQGSAITYTVTANNVGGPFAPPIVLTISGLPVGTTGTFAPASINTGATATLTLNVGAASPIGAKTFTITGTAGTVHTTNADVVVTLPTVNGVCGTANGHAYLSTDLGWGAFTFCSAGTVNPASPAFPPSPGSTPWQCLPSGVGTTASCSASRAAAVPTGNIQVSSVNAAKPLVPVPSSWQFVAGPTDPCAALPLVPCNGTAQTYPGVTLNSSYTFTANPNSAGPLYSLRSVTSHFADKGANPSIFSLAFWEKQLIKIANAFNVAPCGGPVCALTPTAVFNPIFVIDWDPVAQMSVAGSPVAMTNVTPGTVTISNSGAPGSVLNWSVGSITDNSTGLPAGWLSVSAPAPIAQGASQPVTVTYAGALAPGPYSATIVFAGTSSPTGGAVASKSATVNLTVLAPTLVCNPITQTVAKTQPATLTAAGGIPPYTWSAPPDGIPATWSLPSFTVQYPTTGTRSVALTDSVGTTAVPACSVVVNNLQCTFSANPPRIVFPGTVALTWTCTPDALSCSIDQGVGAANPPLGGSKNTSPTSSLTYTLTCNGAGVSTYQAQVQVLVAKPAICEKDPGNKVCPH